MPIFVEHIPGLGALLPAALVVLPNAFVKTVVEIEKLQIFELAGCRTEELFTKLDEGIHRSADIEEQQELDGILALGPHMDIEPALLSCAIDGCIEV